MGPGHGVSLVQPVSPAAAIGLALVVLARVERSGTLLLLAVGDLVLAFLPLSDLGWVIGHPSPWASLPRLVIGGTVLALAGLLFAARQGPWRRAGE